MVVSVEASTYAWFFMCSGLEGDQAGEDGGGAQAEDEEDIGFLQLTRFGFLKTASKNLCTGLAYPSSCRRHTLRVLPYKDKDISFRHLGLWLSSLQLITVFKVTQAQTGLPFQFLSPASSTMELWDVPCSMSIPTEMQSLVLLTLREGGYSLVKDFGSQADLVESGIDFGGRKGYFLWGSLFGPSRFPEEKRHPGDHPSLFNEVFIRTGINIR